jgi:hypothetical protein
MSDMQFRAVRKRSNKSESEKATDSESVVQFRRLRIQFEINAMKERVEKPD